MFKLEFETGNEAFADGNARYEVERILTKVANLAADGIIAGKIHDINGNTIGQWSLDE